MDCCSLAVGTGGWEYTLGDMYKGRKSHLNGLSGESELLQRIAKVGGARKKNLKNSGIRLGIGDDAALWKQRKGHETALTTDWFLEGTHFLRNVHPPDAIGWKSLARAVSDVAAMGGESRCCLISLALPGDYTGRWLAQFMKGVARASRQLNCPLAGGDTTRQERILINVCVIGDVKEGKAVLRSGAKAGDRIFVSGRLGEAELGLTTLRKKKKVAETDRTLLQKHLYPVPRIALGSWLAANSLATAMMDLSDGLSSDLPRLCRASDVGARIFQERLPTAGKAFADRFDAKDRMQAALHGGDDYELLFCVRKNYLSKIPGSFSGIALTEIGEVTADRGIFLADSHGKQLNLTASGWDPFRN